MKKFLYLTFTLRLTKEKINNKVVTFVFDFEKNTTSIIDENGLTLKKVGGVEKNFSKILMKKADELNHTLLVFFLTVDRNNKQINFSAKTKNNSTNEITIKMYE